MKEVKRELMAAQQNRNRALQPIRDQLRESQALLQQEQQASAAAAVKHKEQEELIATLRFDIQEHEMAKSQLKRKAKEQREEDTKRQRTLQHQAAELQTTNHKLCAERAAAAACVEELQASNDELESSKFECCVCQDARPSVLYLPCKHLLLCDECDDDLKARKMPCPACAEAIETRHKAVHT